MTIMKIIDGLYFTIGMILFNPLTGESKTPDQLNEDDRTTYDACMGAIALLKAQEPRVMTLEKVHGLAENDVIWLENIDKEHTRPAIVTPYGAMQDCIDFAVSNRNSLVVEYYYYNSRWRCWTSRPDEKRRHETPWERLN